MLSRCIGQNNRIILGTDKVKGPRCVDYIHRALGIGYRRIDTAQVYMNEKDIGYAVRNSSIPREQVRITTKISAGFKQNPSSFEEAVDSVQTSLARLGLDYIDAILIHHPGDDILDATAPHCRKVTWQAMEALALKGKVKTIGISNFDIPHIQEMQQYATIPPTINQIEIHPWCQRRTLSHYCITTNTPLTIQAHLAIARNTHAQDPHTISLAAKYTCSPAQLLLAYSLQKGYMPIVKASSPAHMLSNYRAADVRISSEDIGTMDSWDEGAEGSIAPWLMGPG